MCQLAEKMVEKFFIVIHHTMVPSKDNSGNRLIA
jgi:hypothetical protein